ncbi:hypothetical protein [Siminovitchia sp. 179-K 8D1 HS]|uniref:hypothetical protein n=1 Tax=Siminovitchia sp. 179-K 8D1 HS TaxID=3142385 RepID=UPI0039A308AB
MKLTLGDISITTIGTSGGVFLGKKNTHQQFRSERVHNEVVGALSGNENKVRQSLWSKTETKEG